MFDDGIHLADCRDFMDGMKPACIDLIVTSPPYDALRSYDGLLVWDFDTFKEVADRLWLVIKKGGVCVWVVGDATIKGSETGTSFRQALYFMDIGFSLHDTMIFAKTSYIPLTHKRYEQQFEYMFVFSKGAPATFNGLRVKCDNAGQPRKRTFREVDGKLREGHTKTNVKADKLRPNIFWYLPNNKVDHPAPYPKQLVIDHITTWTNPGDLIFDPFLGSGTTAIAAKLTGRKFLGCDCVSKYVSMAKVRVAKIA